MKRPREVPPNVHGRVHAVLDIDDDDLALIVGDDPLPAAAAAAVTSKSTAPLSARPLPSSTLALDERRVVDLAFIPLQHRSDVDAACHLFHDAFLTSLRDSPETCEDFTPFMSTSAVRAVNRMDVDDEVTLSMGSSTHEFLPQGLRGYQTSGVDFLLHGFEKGLPRLIADDMGLGKTAQVCAFLEVLSRACSIYGPHLIVSPLSVLASWQRELRRWAPAVPVLRLHGTKSTREAQQETARRFRGVVLTTPAVITQDHRFFTQRPWCVVIFDEAHQLRGDTTLIVRWMSKIRAMYRVAISGTPVSNSPVEVWSIMRFLYPWCSRETAAPPSEDVEESARQCSRLLKRIMLRRTKADVELEIPPRIDHPATVIPLTSLQRRLYFLIANAAKDDLSYTLMQLRKVCNHPMTFAICGSDRATIKATSDADTVGLTRLRRCGIRLDYDTVVAPSGKMCHLHSMLQRLHREGAKVLIFSNFTSQLDLIEGLCVMQRYRYERLDGGTNSTEREIAVQRFNHPSSTTFIFLLTTAAGGVGLTLTAANHVVIYDVNWNPQLDRQAADRAHRLGQHRTVYVHRLIAKDSIEERILQSAVLKAAVGDWIVDEASGEVRVGGNAPGRDVEELSLVVAEIRKAQENASQLKNGGDGADPYSPSSADDSATIERLLRGDPLLPDSATAAIDVPSDTEDDERRGPTDTPPSRAVCLVCRQTSVNVFCSKCETWFHARCLGIHHAGETAGRNWTCPRHECRECGQRLLQIPSFRCTSCVRAYCRDCLDGALFATLNEHGDFAKVSRTAPPSLRPLPRWQREVYYILCPTCDRGESRSRARDTEEVEVSSDESE